MSDVLDRDVRTETPGPRTLPGDAAHQSTLVKPRRLGHATFETPDLDKTIAHYVEVSGLHLAAREKNKAFLATKTGQLAVQLNQGPHPRAVKLSFEVSPNVSFADMARQLSAEGIKSEERSDSIPGMPKVLSFQDPKGTTIELFSEWSYLGFQNQVLGIGPLKLGHFAFRAPDVVGVAQFYGRVLGFRVSDWIGDFFVFMRCGPDHHTVNFITGKSADIHHMAFEVKDFMHLQNACDVLGARKIPIIWGPVRHGPGHNLAIYHRNSDDQIIEFYCELDQLKDEELGYYEPRPWHRDAPQVPKIWDRNNTSVWGPPPTPDFMRSRD